MKSIFITTIFLSTIQIVLHAQQVDVPKTVAQSFNSRYPHAATEQWEKLHNRYEVDFYLNGKKMRSCFSHDGTWNNTCRQVQPNELPQSVLSATNKAANAGWTIDEVYEWQISGKPLEYHVSYKKGRQKKEIIITALGHVVSK